MTDPSSIALALAAQGYIAARPVSLAVAGALRQAARE